MIKKVLYQQITVFSLCLLVNIISHAISPELLAQLKDQNIVDTTHTLTPTQIVNLKKENTLIYQNKKIDLKILMIPHLEKERIELTSIKIFEALKIGNKDLDNGVLLLIAKNDHKMRIEVGYGLERSLTDLESSHIIRDELAPYFKNNDYYTGILNAQKKIGQVDDFSDLALEQTQNENIINVDHPSKHFINYFIVLIWNLSIAILLVIYFSPIYSQFKNKQTPLGIFAFIFIPIHHLFCWVITGLNFFLLLILYPTLIWCVAKLNQHINLFSLLKNNGFPRKSQKKYMILLVTFTLVISFISHQIIPVLFFILFAPCIFFLIYMLIDAIAQKYIEYYPPEYQDWLSKKIMDSIQSKNDDDYTNYHQDSDQTYISSDSYSGSDDTYTSDEERDSGGNSGGGGASGSW